MGRGAHTTTVTAEGRGPQNFHLAEKLQQAVCPRSPTTSPRFFVSDNEACNCLSELLGQDYISLLLLLLLLLLGMLLRIMEPEALLPEQRFKLRHEDYPMLRRSMAIHAYMTGE